MLPVRLNADREILTTLPEMHTTPDQVLVDPEHTGVEGPDPVHVHPVTVARPPPTVSSSSVLSATGAFDGEDVGAVRAARDPSSSANGLYAFFANNAREVPIFRAL